MTSSGCKANRSPSERNNFKSGKSTIVDIFKKDALASSAVTEGLKTATKRNKLFLGFGGLLGAGVLIFETFHSHC